MNPAPFVDPTPSSRSTCRVRDIMSRRVVIAHDHDTLAFASQILLWRGIRHLPIVDQHEQLVGIVSDRDLMRYVVEGPAGGQPLRNVMTSPVETIGPEADLSEASALLAVARIDCLPVVKRGTLVGILTASDVLAERGKLIHKVGRGHIPTACDVMSGRVVVTHRGDSLVSAIQKLVEADVRHMPVVDDDYRVVGMLSDRDVRMVVGDPRAAIDREDDELLRVLRVEEVMTASPLTVPPDASLLQIAELLVDERVGALLVVTDDDKLLGIISYVDVIGHFTGRARR